MFNAPLLFAFAAGMVATVNPCGFAMLPAYVSLFLGGVRGEGRVAPVFVGLRIGAAVTVGFVVLFSAVGLLAAFGLQSLFRFAPWLAVAIGAMLVILGIAVLRGYHLSVRAIGINFRKDGSLTAMAGFGMAYGVASISCTLPVFLAVASQAFSASNFIAGWSLFLAYALGMGVVLTAVAVAMVTSREFLIARMRRALPYIERIGGWLLIASGIYIVYYWSVGLSIPPGEESVLLTPIIFIERLSGRLTQAVADDPLFWTGVLLVIIGVVVVYESLRLRRIRVRGRR